ncbi:inactive transglutaminase family protein [Methylomarinum vadi]|uniref:inactive transglutaminase family protein n=1 Tax=Methylomarinum vadi TaxID=438855 RepID=UPI0004DF94E3|nr:inactive transglutaminase family protein [Methylomarinum vadi]
MKNLHVIILSLALIVISIAICFYKVTELKLPLLPAEQSEVWAVEARISFKANRGPAKVDLLLPKKPQDYFILDESFISGRYGMTLEEANRNRLVRWTLRRPKGSQSLYYRMQIIAEKQVPEPEEGARYPLKKSYPDMMQTAVDALLDEVRSKSADTRSFTHELLLRLNAKDADDNIQLLRKGAEKPELWVERIISILAGARIPARKANILLLKDGIRHGQLTPWLQIYDGSEWVAFDPGSSRGEAGFPENSFVWNIGQDPLLTVKGGRAAKVEFSVHKQFQEAEYIAQQRSDVKHSSVMAWSLFNLPIQTQNVYRILLMMPLGALLIVVLRNLIGIKSFGTFMPILIALAFRETELAWGLVLFTVMVALGLMLRFYLEYLHLLLVPRLAAVLIIVVILMLFLSLLTHKLGIDRGLSVALFPMVILTMTIERMSLVWEELGPAEALQQGIGSLFIASIGYLLMTNPLLEHLIFVFPELLFFLLGITLLLGRYTGYRLTELWRFRALLK